MSTSAQVVISGISKVATWLADDWDCLSHRFGYIFEHLKPKKASGKVFQFRGKLYKAVIHPPPPHLHSYMEAFVILVKSYLKRWEIQLAIQ